MLISMGILVPTSLALTVKTENCSKTASLSHTDRDLCRDYYDLAVLLLHCGSELADFVRTWSV